MPTWAIPAKTGDRVERASGMSDDDPIRKVQRLSRPQLPKRFYGEVSVGEDAEGHVVLLDGKKLRTPKRRLLHLPSAGLAEAVAAEWRGQKSDIDPATMPLTRLANVAVDGVADRMDEVRDELVAYAGSDLICYRADEPESLVALQEREWRPLVAWAEEALGAPLRLAVGVVHVGQDEAVLSAVGGAVAPFDLFGLAALHAVTTLTGSAIIALALARGHFAPDAAWQAAHVDEDWQISQWGEDAEAMANRQRRRLEFEAAVRVLAEAGKARAR